MSDYLPELVVADKEEEEEPKPITHPLGDETDEDELPVHSEREDDTFLIHRDEEETEEEDDGPPEPPAKPSIPHERIFKPLKVKPVPGPAVAEPESKKKKVNFATSPAAVEAVIDIIVNEDPPTAKPKIKKPRKKMSQGQLDALARGRATSLANRKAKAKAKAKIEPVPEPAVAEPKPVQEPEPVKVFKGREPQSQVIQGYTKDDMDIAINNALNKQYELRKERKKKKKAAEQINQVDTRLVEQINRAMDPSNPEYWSSCFNIT